MSKIPLQLEKMEKSQLKTFSGSSYLVSINFTFYAESTPNTKKCNKN